MRRVLLQVFVLTSEDPVLTASIDIIFPACSPGLPLQGFAGSGDWVAPGMAGGGEAFLPCGDQGACALGRVEISQGGDQHSLVPLSVL